MNLNSKKIVLYVVVFSIAAFTLKTSCVRIVSDPSTDFRFKEETIKFQKKN